MSVKSLHCCELFCYCCRCFVLQNQVANKTYFKLIQSGSFLFSTEHFLLALVGRGHLT